MLMFRWGTSSAQKDNIWIIIDKFKSEVLEVNTSFIDISDNPPFVYHRSEH